VAVLDKSAKVENFAKVGKWKLESESLWKLESESFDESGEVKSLDKSEKVVNFAKVRK